MTKVSSIYQAITLLKEAIAQLTENGKDALITEHPFTEQFLTACEQLQLATIRDLEKALATTPNLVIYHERLGKTSVVKAAETLLKHKPTEQPPKAKTTGQPPVFSLIVERALVNNRGPIEPETLRTKLALPQNAQLDKSQRIIALPDGKLALLPRDNPLSSREIKDYLLQAITNKTNLQAPPMGLSAPSLQKILQYWLSH